MHVVLVKKILRPLFDHFVDLQILTIWGQRSGSDPQPKKIGSQPKKIGSPGQESYILLGTTPKYRGGTFLRLGFNIRIGSGRGPQPKINRFY